MQQSGARAKNEQDVTRLASNFRNGHNLAHTQYLQKQEAEVSARKGTVERAAAQKEIPFEQSLSKISTIPMDESFKQPECFQNEKLI